jgi:hypothetical protein
MFLARPGNDAVQKVIVIWYAISPTICVFTHQHFIDLVGLQRKSESSVDGCSKAGLVLASWNLLGVPKIQSASTEPIYLFKEKGLSSYSR